MSQTTELTERRVKFVHSLASVVVRKNYDNILTSRSFMSACRVRCLFWREKSFNIFSDVSTLSDVLSLDIYLSSTLPFEWYNSIIPEISKTFISLEVQERPWRQSWSSGNHFLLRWFVHVKHTPFDFRKCLLMTWKQTILSWNKLPHLNYEQFWALHDLSTTTLRPNIMYNWLQL